MSSAVIVGAGPNGLAAAVVLARAGIDVEVFEANSTVGGGARSELLDGSVVDWGSAVHPMALTSPFMRKFALADRIPFVTPEASYAHPLDGGAVVAWRDIDHMRTELPTRQSRAWIRLLAPLVDHLDQLSETVLDSMWRIPAHPALLAQFGTRVLAHGSPLGAASVGVQAAAALAGVFAHSVSPLPRPAAAAAGLVLAAAGHSRGWPIPLGGTQRISDALATDIIQHGGRIHTGQRISHLDDLPNSRALIMDVAPDDMIAIVGDRLHPRYARALRRHKKGNAASRVDFILSEPVPWRSEGIGKAGTVHIGGTAREIAASEHAVSKGHHPEHPYVLASQPSLFDDSRAVDGAHTLWSYAHVPSGSTVDMTELITRQIERFAPGFRDTIIQTRAITASELEAGNANLRGGDIGNGRIDLGGLLVRPVISKSPWRAGKGVYLCSAATPPGPGVHGMGGFHAANLALREIFGIRNDVPLSPITSTDAV